MNGTGASAPGSNLSEVVILLVVVSIAYLIAHFVLERVERRFLMISGLEYMLLGVMLGPTLPQIRAFDDLTGLLPFIALAAGWFGLLRGMELARFRETPAGTLALAILDDLGAGLGVAIPAGLLFTSTGLITDSWSDAWMAAGVLGCCAAVASTDPADVLERRYRVTGSTLPLLRHAARIGDAIAIIAFGILFCYFHRHVGPTPLDDYLKPGATWIGLLALSVGMGVGFGLLFRFFLAGDESENTRFLAFVGIITFASGAAWLLELSLLFVNMLLGLALFLGSKRAGSEKATMERTQRPMMLVLLVFAGALWTPPPAVQSAVAAFWAPEPDVGAALAGTTAAFFTWIVAPTAGFVILRIAGKWIGSGLASWGTPVRADSYRGLLGMGDVTIAMAVSFKLVFDGPAVVDVAYTTVLGAVVFHDIIAPRVLRSLVVDAGELLGERAEAG